MKKLLILFGALLLAIGLSACGNDSSASSKKDDKYGEGKSSAEKQAEWIKNHSSDDNSDYDDEATDDTETDDGTVDDSNSEYGDEKVYSDTYVLKEFRSGPIKIKVNNVKVSDFTPNEENSDLQPGTEIVINADIENTSDKNITLFIDQSKVTTDTGIQVEVDSMLSDWESDFLGKVHKEETLYFFSPEPVNNMKKVIWHIDKPTDSEQADYYGKDFKIEIPLK